MLVYNASLTMMQALVEDPGGPYKLEKLRQFFERVMGEMKHDKLVQAVNGHRALRFSVKVSTSDPFEGRDDMAMCTNERETLGMLKLRLEGLRDSINTEAFKLRQRGQHGRASYSEGRYNAIVEIIGLMRTISTNVETGDKPFKE